MRIYHPDHRPATAPAALPSPSQRRRRRRPRVPVDAPPLLTAGFTDSDPYLFVAGAQLHTPPRHPPKKKLQFEPLVPNCNIILQTKSPSASRQRESQTKRVFVSTVSAPLSLEGARAIVPPPRRPATAPPSTGPPFSPVGSRAADRQLGSFVANATGWQRRSTHTQRATR